MSNPVVEAAKAKSKELKESTNFGEREETPRWKPKNGDNQVRILPPPPGDTMFWREFKVAFDVGPNKRMVVPARQFGHDLPDPFSDYLDRLYATHNPGDKAVADRMWPNTRYHLWVIDRSEADPRPRLYGCTPAVFRDITAIFADPDYDDITDPETGTDITIRYVPKEQSKTKKFPEIHIIPKRKPSKLSEDPELLKQWTSEDLFKRYRVGEPYDADYVEKILAGTDLEKKADDEGTGGTVSQQSADTSFFGPGNPHPSDVAPAAPPAKPPAAAEEPKLWVVHPESEEVVQMTRTEIQHWVDTPQGGVSTAVMALDQSGGWQTAADFGFKPTPKQPPKPAKAVPAPAAPPPAKAPAPKAATAPPFEPNKPGPTKAVTPQPTDEGDDDEKALKAQLEELRRKKAAAAGGNGSKAASDLTKALEG